MVGDLVAEGSAQQLTLVLSRKTLFESPVEARLANTGGAHNGLRSTVAAKPSPRRSNFVPGVAVPAGNPFVNVGNAGFLWSATQSPDDPSQAYGVFYLGPAPGSPGGMGTFTKTGSTVRAWCVRGADTQ